MKRSLNMSHNAGAAFANPLNQDDTAAGNGLHCISTKQAGDGEEDAATGSGNGCK